MVKIPIDATLKLIVKLLKIKQAAESQFLKKFQDIYAFYHISIIVTLVLNIDLMRDKNSDLQSSAIQIMLFVALVNNNFRKALLVNKIQVCIYLFRCIQVQGLY